jgi:hypothetical protein
LRSFPSGVTTSSPSSPSFSPSMFPLFQINFLNSPSRWSIPSAHPASSSPSTQRQHRIGARWVGERATCADCGRSVVGRWDGVIDVGETTVVRIQVVDSEMALFWPGGFRSSVVVPSILVE